MSSRAIYTAFLSANADLIRHGTKFTSVHNIAQYIGLCYPIDHDLLAEAFVGLGFRSRLQRGVTQFAVSFTKTDAEALLVRIRRDFDL